MTEFMDPQVAFDKIASFDVAEEVAGFLIGEGVHGIPGKYDLCPLAVWFRQVTGQAVTVSPSLVTFTDSDGVHTRFDHTLGMQYFVRMFDRRRFPQLQYQEM